MTLQIRVQRLQIRRGAQTIRADAGEVSSESGIRSLPDAAITQKVSIVSENRISNLLTVSGASDSSGEDGSCKRAFAAL